MSSVSPVGWQPPTQVSGVEPMTGASAPPVPYLQGTLNGVANLLSLSPTDLRSSLKAGSSISDIAAQKGVSRDSIVQYIEQQVQSQRSAQGKQPIDPQALDQVVNKAVDRHRGGHRHHHPAPPPTPGTQQQPSSFALDQLI